MAITPGLVANRRDGRDERDDKINKIISYMRVLPYISSNKRGKALNALMGRLIEDPWTVLRPRTAAAPAATILMTRRWRWRHGGVATCLRRASREAFEGIMPPAPAPRSTEALLETAFRQIKEARSLA
jgi:hypothetical protein